MKTALIVGAGPAGLMAADVLSAAGVAVTVADAMPSVGRKFLMAGKSGLNLTKVSGDFSAAYGAVDGKLLRAVDGFGPQDVIDWANALGQPTFVGSTGRVFPEVMKASPLLRAWMTRLGQNGVEVRTRWRATGISKSAIQFETPDGPLSQGADVVVLAMGGASWRRLGSDGAWAQWLPIASVGFQPANVGFQVDWSPHMREHFSAPVKGTRLTAGPLVSRGEWVISERGIEGGGIYTVSSAVRDGAELVVDLCPDLSEPEVQNRLAKPRGKASLTNHLRKRLGLDPVKIALLNEFGRPFPSDLTALIKKLPIRHQGPRPIDEAISVAGGVSFDALTDQFMLHQMPGVFCAGEMLDWEAPTGGYLLTACFATGRAAALGALAYLGDQAAAEMSKGA
jgi:uncharacterized flavoprotein (TIGR03862 family)